MPILKEETYLSPPVLFDESYLLSRVEEGAKWYAVYTMSRREKEFMRKIIPYGVPFYCPIIGIPKRSPQGRVRTTFAPLFSNYVFINATDEQRIQALKSNCISRCLEVPDDERLIFDLSQISKLIASKAEMHHEATLEKGTYVRIKSGPLKGLEGVVVQRRSESRLLVAVDYLSQGTSVELKDYDVEKL